MGLEHERTIYILRVIQVNAQNATSREGQDKDIVGNLSSYEIG